MNEEVIQNEAPEPQKMVTKKVMAQEVYFEKKATRVNILLGIIGILVPTLISVVSYKAALLGGMGIAGVLGFFLIKTQKQMNYLKQKYFPNDKI